MPQLSTGLGRDEVRPLVCAPKRAAQLLDVSLSMVYQLMTAGELEHFLDGKSRRITTSSLEAYIARRLAGMTSRRPASREARKAASQRIAD
jgi:excisionase family DNA binding protein